MKRIPWIISAVLAVLLVCTNIPTRFRSAGVTMPSAWRHDETRLYELLNAGTRSAVWVVREKSSNTEIVERMLEPFMGDEKEQAYVITLDGQVIADVAEGASRIRVLQDGNVIATIETSPKMYYGYMRHFLFYDPPGEHVYSLHDYDGDGLIDSKSTTGKFWTYEHGHYVAADPNTRFEIIVRLLDGSRVALEEGKWIPVDSKDSRIGLLHEAHLSHE